MWEQHIGKCLLTLCFWSLEPEKFKRRNQKHCRGRYYGWVYNRSRRCVEGCPIFPHAHLKDIVYTNGVGVKFCFVHFYRFSQDLNDGQAGARYPAFYMLVFLK